MRYKASKYNIFDYYDKGVLLYNTYSGAFVFVPQEIKEKVSNILSLPYIDNSEFDKELITELFQGGFLVDSDFDETESLKESYYKFRKNENYLSIILLASENCNFSCPYCFIYKKRAIDMQDSVYESVIKLIEKRLSKINHLKIQFFGGEPLLNHKRNITFLKKVNSLLLGRSIYKEFGIVTNGYLLDKEIFKDYLNQEVRFYQVTLDGSKKYHNLTRFTHNDRNTFMKIIENIFRCQEVDENFNFVIRINFQKDDDKIDELIDYLKSRFYNDKRFNVVFRPVMDFKTHKIDEDISICSKIEGQVKQMNFLLNYYSNRIIDYDKHMIFLPKRISAWCEVQMFNSYIIGADGLIFKCDVEIGDVSFSIGGIDEDGNIKMEMDNYFLNYDTYKDEKCLKCKLLPICQGGCIRSRKIDTNYCYYNIGLIKDMMRKYHELLK